MRIVPKRWKELSVSERRNILKRSETDIEEVRDSVEKIIDSVRKEGDEALRRYTLEFDKADISALPIEVSTREYEEAEAQLSEELKGAIRYSAENVRRFYASRRPAHMDFTTVRPGILAAERTTPVDSAGLYVPRGRGSFPSMLYMLSVPADIAGVPNTAVASPPNPDGSVDPGCLYTAKITGVDRVYRIGGAQAIAALACGTESVQPVVKLLGPGSRYVTAAKRAVSPWVDTGLPAGPSESMILADDSADPRSTALDLLVEAEHGADSCALLITSSRKLAEDTAEYASKFAEELPRERRGFVEKVFSRYGGVLLVDSIEEGAELVNDFAPEHLQIRTCEPFTTMELIRNAGEILLGEHIPFSAANYSTGPNAVLPTGGAAKSFSPVSVMDFMKVSSVVYAEQRAFRKLAPQAALIAEYEGFAAHGKALTDREVTRGELD
ncbi:MAG: histidinol dehydrogenase [Spirochaetaceae bacterium]